MTKELDEIKEQLEKHFEEGTGLNDLSPADLAEHLKVLKRHDEDEYANYLEKLDSQSLGEVAIEMPDHMLKDLIQNVPNDKIAKAIEELESDDATDLLQYIEDIDEGKAKELFCSLELDSQKEISKLINYAENEAGAYMQTELFSAKLDEKLSSVISRFRVMKKLGEIENIFQLFVVDKNGILCYAIPLEDLIVYDFDLNLENIVKDGGVEKYKPHAATDTDDISEVATMVKDFDLSAIAVVNKAGVLLGRITTDDIHDFLEESATEQIYNLAGVDDEAEEEDTLFKAGRARAVWLFINLITALISASIIGLFDKTIEAYVALAILMPIVASMGGNTGTQALAVTVRKLATHEIDFSDVKRVIFKEVSIAFINGLIFATLMGIIAYIWFGVSLLGVVIAISMVINLFCAGFFGTLIPLVLKKFSIDPAVGSSVLLTTVTDTVGFFSFLGLAKWILL
ncbi:magnesium transporter [Campylobacter hyointestinalis]|uniref:Magnesium transporter MgtE n=1 Tax=Campylobacter hyointestinalis subsp. hyointestinalis TaxID=91352 RepID=A0A855N8U9_CAMHY|nr:magnesium transporter [Campylobacter hyointestinalis]MDY2999059.1 magnesium transporter [Campylobacter hyointestinalis]PPB59948.1 magnesium transporter [Campylobacter hyointestinalis subsp. hyointestinalis]PPB63592.1 magnesium transporter [Campylobacter hyointestinalis subsp. hyointestinalis]PPB72872.1 magnesium transporter [Campylobacter hyointestinalis subsp. hyointestinalis]